MLTDFLSPKFLLLANITYSDTNNPDSSNMVQIYDIMINSLIDKESTVFTQSIMSDFTGFIGRCGNNGIPKRPLLTHSPKKIAVKSYVRHMFPVAVKNQWQLDF